MNKTKSPRLSSVEILVEWQNTGTSIDLLIGKHSTAFESRDVGLLKALILGVLRRYALLDWVVGKYSKQPLKKIQPILLQALRVGIYQLLFMDRIPASAAVNETVKALKSLKQPRWISGFANGLLRTVERQKAELSAAIGSGHIPASARLNHPDWLVERWERRFGKAGLDEMCRSNSEPARLCLRVNTLKCSVKDFVGLLASDGIACRTGRLIAEAIWIEAENILIESLPGYDEGYFSVQDEMAQLLCTLLAPFTAGSYLDACAGLGGKTAVVAQLAPKGSTIVAVEPSAQRLSLLSANCTRLGLSGVDIFQGSLQEYNPPSAESFEAVLVDAPCSGLGVTGRHPDIRWQRQPDDLKRYQRIQLELLERAATLVSHGGVLVYATCSTEPEENDEVVEQFLAADPEFRVEDARRVLSGKGQELVDEKGFLRTIPGPEVSDGFFAARLVRS